MSQSLFATTAPMPAKPRVKIKLVGDELTLDWRRRQWGVAGFLCLWLTGWSAGCGMMIYQLLTKFEWQMALFATPFFTAWFVVAGLIIYMLLGRQRLVLSRDKMTITWTAGITYYRRSVPLDEVVHATPDVTYTHRKNGPPMPVGVLTMETLGKPAPFATDINDDEARWLAETINLCLDSLAPHRTALASAKHIEKPDHREREDLDQLEEELADDHDDTEVVVFESTDERQLRPSDSTWELDQQGPALEFTNRGHWSLGSIGGTLFINLFWNGIVSLFVVQLFKEFEWFLALFLVPFVVIGLCIFAAFLSAITAPGWGERYSIRFGQIEHRWWCPVYAQTKTFLFERLDRIEISESGFAGETNKNQIAMKHFSQGDYRISLVDTNNAEVVAIESLTEGEALWMADTILFEHPEMFDRDR